MEANVKLARTFEFVLHFVGCVTVTVSPNQIIIIIIIIIIKVEMSFQVYLLGDTLGAGWGEEEAASEKERCA